MSQLRGGATPPRSPFPILPLRTGVLFPGTVITLPVGRKRSVALLESLQPGDVIGVVTQRDPKVIEPAQADLHEIGTFVRVVETTRTASGEYRLALEGLSRLALESVIGVDPFWTARGTTVEETNADGEDARLLADSLREHVQELTSKGGGTLAQVAVSAAEPSVFADQVASALGMSTEKELSVLAERDVPAAPAPGGPAARRGQGVLRGQAARSRPTCGRSSARTSAKHSCASSCARSSSELGEGRGRGRPRRA